MSVQITFILLCLLFTFHLFYCVCCAQFIHSIVFAYHIYSIVSVHITFIPYCLCTIHLHYCFCAQYIYSIVFVVHITFILLCLCTSHLLYIVYPHHIYSIMSVHITFIPYCLCTSYLFYCACAKRWQFKTKMMSEEEAKAFITQISP